MIFRICHGRQPVERPVPYSADSATPPHDLELLALTWCSPWTRSNCTHIRRYERVVYPPGGNLAAKTLHSYVSRFEVDGRLCRMDSGHAQTPC